MTCEKQLCLDNLNKFNNRDFARDFRSFPYVNPCLDRGSSHLAVLGKRVNLMAGHHKMVEDADIDQGQRLHQRPGQQ